MEREAVRGGVNIRTGPHRPEKFGFDPSVCWGVFVGDCVADDPAHTLSEVDGHAHTYPRDQWRGWICIIDPKRVLTRGGRPSLLLRHELAHLLQPGQGHNARWKDQMAELGARAEAKRYERRK